MSATAANPGANMAAAVEAEYAKFRDLQELMAKDKNDLQTLIGQQNENEMVKQELELLDDSSNVYKLVGPVLMKNELDDAKQTVSKRLEFINGEISKLEKNIKTKEKKGTEIAQKVQEMQGAMQKAAVAAAQQAAQQQQS
mmetsp:Transcript_27961/g.39318  ORF Transcript_27961/g.39318 Transcript_27961/m.39318 type:complete len:140 (-) Transcript_27961:40-459(-)